MAVAGRTVEDARGRLPLLAPMSEVAGKIATQAGAFMLEKPLGGRGILLGGVPGVPPADVLVLGGDLTNFGRPEEMESLLNVIVRLRIPTIAVLGNHDYESGRASELMKLMTEAGIKVLDGTAYERDGVGPRWPWYLEPTRALPYGCSAGLVSRSRQNCPIFIPGHSVMGRFATLDSSSVI